MDIAPSYLLTTEKRPITMHGEDHLSRNCRCRREKIYYNGKYYFVFYRKCDCHQYSDRSKDTYLPSDLKNEDGIDIHEHGDCVYQFSESRISSKWTFLLHCYCSRSVRNMRR